MNKNRLCGLCKEAIEALKGKPIAAMLDLLVQRRLGAEADTRAAAAAGARPATGGSRSDLNHEAEEGGGERVLAATRIEYVLG